MADAVAFGKRMMKPGAHGHLVFSALQFDQRYKMLSREREEKDSDSHGGKGIATKRGEGKKKAVLRSGMLRCVTPEK